MSVVFRDVDDGLQHQDGEGDTFAPREETEYVKEGEDHEHHRGRIIVPREIHNRRDDTHEDLENGGYINDLFREMADHEKVSQGDQEGDDDN
jgi:hypothetical protein